MVGSGFCASGLSEEPEIPTEEGERSSTGCRTELGLGVGARWTFQVAAEMEGTVIGGEESQCVQLRGQGG